MILEPIGEEYPYLTLREFLFTHMVRATQGTICSFMSLTKFRLANLKPHHSNAKQWQNKFLFMKRDKLELPLGEVTIHKLLVRSDWGIVPDDKRIEFDLFD